MDEIEKVGSFCFWTTGENMTRTIRDLWEEGSCAHSFRVAKEGLGMTDKQALDLVEGRMKLDGDSRNGGLDGVEDSYSGKTVDTMFNRKKVRYIEFYINYIGYDVRIRNTMIRSLRNGDGDGISNSEYSTKAGIQVEKKKLELLKEITFLCEISDHNIDEVFDSLFIQMKKVEAEDKKEVARAFIEVEEKKVARKIVDDFVKERITEDKAPIKIGQIGDSVNGWIDPAGHFYICGNMGHITLADKLGFDERELEKKNWLKMTNNRFIKYSEIKPTKQQFDFFMEWQMENDMSSIDFNGLEYKTVDEIKEGINGA